MSEQTQANITVKQAEVILQFLQRTQMQGAEMPAYVDIFNTLSGIVGTVKSEASASADEAQNLG